MADPADLAQVEDLIVEMRIRAVRNKSSADAPRELVPRKVCYNCEDPVGPEQLFCDEFCEQDWSNRRRLTGGPRWTGPSTADDDFIHAT